MAPLRFALTAFLGVIAGYLIALAVIPDRAPPERPPSSDPGPEPIERLADRLDELNSELDTARSEESLLRAELSRARRALSDRADGSVNSVASVASARFDAGGAPGRSIRSLAEAEAAYQQAFAAGDLEALWLLGADLLAFGEEGYPHFERLVERFAADGEGDLNALQRIWHVEELWMGRFFRVLAEEHESVLTYGLSLADRDASELGPTLSHLRREFFDDAFLPTLLAFHGAQNAELSAAWLDHFESRLALPDLGGADPETILFGIAQIPGDRSVDLLVEWIETRSSRQDDAIDALILMGGPRATAALRALLPGIEDESLRAAIALRLRG